MTAWLKNRVQKRLDALRLGPVEAATKSGLERTYIRDIIEGKKETVRAAGALMLELALKAPKEYFLFEDYDLPDDFDVAAPNDREDSDPDKIKIDQIDLRFGMGIGGMGGDDVQAVAMSFSPAWMRQLTNAPPHCLLWATGMGDSMTPTIADGDLVLVDRTQTQPKMSDQIWAIFQYGHGQIKRLRPTHNGYQLLSDNPSIPPDTAVDGSMEVMGRVVAVVKRL